VRLLTTADASEAERLARNLDVQNKERQAIERKMLGEALRQGEQQVQAGARALVLSGEGWHAGVVGIVAARVMERLHRPTLVIAVNEGVGKGSGRSLEGFHLYEALKACEGLLDKFGGHKHAAGLTVRAERLTEFEVRFQRYAEERLHLDDLQPRLRLDAQLHLAQVSLDLIHQIEALGPFGAGNPEPTFYGRALAGDVRTLNNKNDGEPHLKLTLRHSDVDRPVSAIGFGMGKLAELCRQPVLAAFQVQVDDYGGTAKPQLRLRHLKPAEGAAS
jgi:single-stranded-DNA-specific exonuclease